MSKRGLLLLTVLIAALSMTSVAFGRDFFLFDLEKNKLLFMGTNDVTFTEKMDLEKVPDLVTQTNDPNKYLIVYMPEEEDDKAGQPTMRGASEYEKYKRIYKNSGKIILADLSKGRTEDIVEIGYGPFCTTLSKDKKHFLISYRPKSEDRFFKILYYNIPDKKSEILKENFTRVNGLDFSMDSTTLFALVKNGEEKNYELLSLGLNPVNVKNSLPAGFYPYKSYSLSNNRLALLDVGGTLQKGTSVFSEVEENNGTIQLIDSEKNQVLQTVVFKPSNVNYRWFKEQNTLFISTLWYNHRLDSSGEVEWFGEGHFFRITDQGMTDTKTQLFWDYSYDAERDTLYVLADRTLEVYDLKNNSKKNIKTGINWYTESYTKAGKSYSMTLNYFVRPIPEFHLAVVYSNYKGVIKFYDLETGKMVNTFKGAKINAPYPEDYKYLSSVNTNQSKKRLYILDRNKKGLNIYNDKFEPLGSWSLNGEQPIGMYRIDKPTEEMVLVTENGLYKIEETGLKSIVKFEKKAENVYLYKDDKHLLFFIDDDWYVIDSATFEMKFHINEFGDPNDKYTKVKKGERRYFYVQTPYDWSE